MGFEEDLPSTYRRMLELLRENGSMTVDELAERLQVKPSTIRKYALELEKRGLVVRMGRVISIAQKQERTSVEPFYFINPGAVTLLPIRSLRQLAAVLHYEIVSDEMLSYALRGGYLAAWLRHIVGEEELAKKVEELRESAPREARERLLRLLQPYL